MNCSASVSTVYQCVVVYTGIIRVHGGTYVNVGTYVNNTIILHSFILYLTSTSVVRKCQTSRKKSCNSRKIVPMSRKKFKGGWQVWDRCVDLRGSMIDVSTFEDG